MLGHQVHAGWIWDPVQMMVQQVFGDARYQSYKNAPVTVFLFNARTCSASYSFSGSIQDSELSVLDEVILSGAVKFSW